MDILWYHPAQDGDAWLQGLQRRIPQARVRRWQPGDSAPAEYVIARKPPPELLKGRRSLRAVFAMGAGVDDFIEQLTHHPDMLAETVPLIRLEDCGMARQMQEYAVYSVLGWFRRFDDYRQQQRVPLWQPLAPRRREAFSIGVAGAGVLGMSVINALKSWGFPLRVWSRSLKQIDGVTAFAGPESLGAFLRGSRVLINLLPATPETRHLFNAARFRQLPEGAFFLNLARGAQVVEEDLLDALNSGRLKAAALDVFEVEPLAETHALWTHPHVSITPHIAAVTLADQAMDAIARAIGDIEAGRPPSGCVDRLRGY